METIKNFITKQYKTIITVLIVLFISYWVIFILTPRNTMISENKEKIDLLNDVIENIRKEQNTLEDRITDVNKDIVLIENNITKNTFALITKSHDDVSSKTKKANELGIPIMTPLEFIEKYL